MRRILILDLYRFFNGACWCLMGIILYEEDILKKSRQLPDDLKKEVLEFIEKLLKKSKGTNRKKKGFKFNWEGGLSELKDKFSSVELQHKSLEWR